MAKRIFITLLFIIVAAIIIFLIFRSRGISFSSATLSPTGLPKKPYLIPTLTYQNSQTCEILIWKKYSNNTMRISFDYPDNLKHSYPEGENPSALKEELNRVCILKGMSEIFSVEKINTTDDVETWQSKNNAKNNNGNGIMTAKTTKTYFRNRPAYYFTVKDEQQVPSDFYIIPFQGHLLKISFNRLPSLSQVINSSCNEYGECDINALYFDRDYEESFRRFDNLIINRILSSIEFF